VSSVIEFHVLESSQETRWLHYVAELSESLLSTNMRLLILSDQPAFLNAIDEKLWTFKDNSFIAHERVNGTTPPLRSGVVGIGHELLECDLVIHLGLSPLESFGTATRVIDVIDSEPQRREAGRARFSAYRKRGMSPETIKNPPTPALDGNHSSSRPQST